MKELLRELFLIMEDNISDSKERYDIYQQFISHLFEVDNEILEYLLTILFFNDVNVFCILII